MGYRFHHIHLLCSDLQHSIDFFTRILGATLVARKKFGKADGATLDLNETTINLRVAAENETVNADTSHPAYGYHHMGLTVKDTDAAYQELTEKGFEFITPPVDAGGNRIAFFKGPDNIVIELLQPL